MYFFLFLRLLPRNGLPLFLSERKRHSFSDASLLSSPFILRPYLHPFSPYLHPFSPYLHPFSPYLHPPPSVRSSARLSVRQLSLGRPLSVRPSVRLSVRPFVRPCVCSSVRRSRRSSNENASSAPKTSIAVHFLHSPLF